MRVVGRSATGTPTHESSERATERAFQSGHGVIPRPHTRDPRWEDYETALATPEVRALSSRVRCVVDPEIEAMTNTEEEPSRVTVKLADGHELVAKVDHPRGSPHRRMTWTELRELFRDTLADTLPEGAMQTVQARPVSICIKGFPS